MAKITDYPKVSELQDTNVFLIDEDKIYGTRGILAKDLVKALLKMIPSKNFSDKININDLTDLSGVGLSVTGSDKLLVETDSGKRSITISDAVFELLDSVATTPMRRQYYRGKNLGSVVTTDQYAEIRAGTFKGMFIGDFWDIGDRRWRIVDFDYWLGTGDKKCTTHHLVIMPDEHLDVQKMNDSIDRNGKGYAGSSMRSTHLAPIRTIIEGAFGARHLLSHREYLVNAVVDGGGPTGFGWYTSVIDLPNEIMIYGGDIYSALGESTIDNIQLAAMAANPSLINPSHGVSNLWLRDVAAYPWFTAIGGEMQSNYYGATTPLGIRPVFGLIG